MINTKLSGWVSITLGTYIEIKEAPATDRKTKLFHIWSKEGAYLGAISFWPKWRKYTFFPQQGTLYEEVCLREIADFIEKQTHQWRESCYQRLAAERDRK